MYKIDLYQIKNMRITDPCKKCLVRPICSRICNEYIKRMNFGEMMNDIKERIVLIIKSIFEKIYLFITIIVYSSFWLIMSVLAVIVTFFLGLGALYTLNQLYLLWMRIIT